MARSRTRSRSRSAKRTVKENTRSAKDRLDKKYQSSKANKNSNYTDSVYERRPKTDSSSGIRQIHSWLKVDSKKHGSKRNISNETKDSTKSSSDTDSEIDHYESKRRAQPLGGSSSLKNRSKSSLYSDEEDLLPARKRSKDQYIDPNFTEAKPDSKTLARRAAKFGVVEDVRDKVRDHKKNYHERQESYSSEDEPVVKKGATRDSYEDGEINSDEPVMKKGRRDSGDSLTTGWGFKI